MQIKIRSSHDTLGSSRRILSLAVTGALLAPGATWAASGGLVADGQALNPPVDSYLTEGYAEHVLRALNSGSITTTAGTTVSSSGASAYGAYAIGAGSQIALVGTSVTTSGNVSAAVFARDGANLTVTGGSNGRRSTLSTSGNGSDGALAEGAGSRVHIEDTDVTTTGQISYGVRLGDGTLGSILNSTIRTTGRDAHGIQLTRASATIAGSRITTEGARSHAPSFDRDIAEDVLDQLEKILPPAHTELQLSESATDPFGKALVASLRQHGYAVHEPEPVKLTWRNRNRKHQPQAHEFWYLKEGIDGMDMIRVEVGQGSRRLSRLYLFKDGNIFGAGGWAHRE